MVNRTANADVAELLGTRAWSPLSTESGSGVVVSLITAHFALNGRLGPVPGHVGKEVGDGLCSLGLHAGNHVCVLLEREGWCGMAEALAHHLHRDARPQADGGVSMVGSDRGAVLALQPVRFLGPSSEPDVRLPPHPALRRLTSCGCPNGHCPRRRVDDLSPVPGVADHYGTGIEHRHVALGRPPPRKVAASEPLPVGMGMLWRSQLTTRAQV